MTRGIDEDVDLIGVDDSGAPLGGRARDVPEHIEGGAEVVVELPFVAAGGGLNGVTVDVEAIAIVTLDDVHEHVRHAREPCVRQEVADPDLVAPRAGERKGVAFRRLGDALRDVARLVARGLERERVGDRKRV